MNGNNVYISIGEGTSAAIIAGTKVNEIQTECETIEISGPNVAKWRQFIVKRKEWGMTANFLITTNAQIQGILQSGTEVGILVVGRSGTTSAVLLQGRAIVKQGKQSFSRGKLAEGSWKFVGNGPLSVPENLSLE